MDAIEDRRGLANIEYVLLAMGVAVVVIVSLTAMGGSLRSLYGGVDARVAGQEGGERGATSSPVAAVLSIQKKLQAALGLSDGASAQVKVQACNGAMSRMTATVGSAPPGVVPSVFNEACATAMIQASYVSPADFMSDFRLPVGASLLVRSTSCVAQGMTSSALSACLGTSTTAFQVMNGTLPVTSWSNADLPVATNSSALAFNEWVQGQK